MTLLARKPRVSMPRERFPPRAAPAPADALKNRVDGAQAHPGQFGSPFPYTPAREEQMAGRSRRGGLQWPRRGGLKWPHSLSGFVVLVS
jgi:hypothetical protein